MKIAIVVNGRPHEGGVTTYINNIADALRELNCDIRVVTIFGASQYREVHSSFKETADTLLKRHKYVTKPAYIFSKIVLGIRVVIELLGSQYDLIYANDISVVNALAYWKKIIRLPVVLMVHYPINRDLISQGKIRSDTRLHKYFLEEEKRGYKQAVKIITPSQYVEKWINELQPDHAPIKVIRLPMDERKFRTYENRDEIRSRIELVQDDFAVMFCGRLANRKGPEFPIMALNSMEIQDRKGIKLIYLGDGPDRKKLEQMALSFGISDHVIFKGAVAYSDMPQYYLASDVVVVPSVTYDGFADNTPNVVFEAMAARVPVVAFKSGGLAELMQHEYSGFLIEERNIDELAAVLLKLKLNRQLRSDIANNGFARLQAIHSPKVVGQMMLDYFTSVI